MGLGQRLKRLGTPAASTVQVNKGGSRDAGGGIGWGLPFDPRDTESNPVPTILSMSPSTLTVGTTTVVTITGTLFGLVNTLTLTTGITATNVTTVNQTTLLATLTVASNADPNSSFTMSATTGRQTSNALAVTVVGPNAYRFPVTAGSYVSVPNLPYGGTRTTMMAWFMMAGVPDSGNHIPFAEIVDSGNPIFLFSVAGMPGEAVFEIGFGDGQGFTISAQSTTAVVANQWYKVTLVFDDSLGDGNRARIYLSTRSGSTYPADSLMALTYSGDGACNLTYAATNTTIMGLDTTMGSPANQLLYLEEFRIYANTALSQAQVQAESLTSAPAGTCTTRYPFDTPTSPPTVNETTGGTSAVATAVGSVTPVVI